MTKFLQSRSTAVRLEFERIRKFAPVLLGLSYGVVEYFFVSSSPFSAIFISPPEAYLYRLLYVTILFLPFATSNYWRWFAKGTLAMIVEDASYWAFDYWKTGALPVQWAWYYPVWNNIPLLYSAIPLLFLFRWRGRRWDQTE